MERQINRECYPSLFPKSPRTEILMQRQIKVYKDLRVRVGFKSNDRQKFERIINDANGIVLKGLASAFLYGM